MTRLERNLTRQNVTDAVTLLRSEADRLGAIVIAYEEAGDSLKAADIESLAEGLRDSAEDFSGIIRGVPPGAGANMAILTEQALEGVNC